MGKNVQRAEVEEKKVRFVIWSFQDSVVNNLRLNFEGRVSYYEQICCDRSGKIYTYSYTKNGIDIYQWK